MKSTIKQIVIAGLWLSFIFGLPVHAEQTTPEYTPESQQLLNQLEGQIKGTLMAITENERKVGRSMDDFYFSIEVPAQQEANLGMVIDVENVEKGYQVLSVTPGSLAEKINIRSGDKIVAINDVEVKDASDNTALKQLQELTPGQQLKLAFNSKGDVKEAVVEMSGDYMPGIKLEIGSQSVVKLAALTNSDKIGTSDSVEKVDSESNACGQVSVFFRPPESKDIYPAYINAINDRNVVRSRHSFRLPPGKHTIKIHELITDPFLRRSRGLQKAKPIEIDVKPNMSYYLGAKFIRAKRSKVYKELYWEPVVWRTSERSCEL